MLFHYALGLIDCSFSCYKVTNMWSLFTSIVWYPGIFAVFCCYSHWRLLWRREKSLMRTWRLDRIFFRILFLVFCISLCLALFQSLSQGWNFDSIFVFIQYIQPHHHTHGLTALYIVRSRPYNVIERTAIMFTVNMSWPSWLRRE